MLEEQEITNFQHRLVFREVRNVQIRGRVICDAVLANSSLKHLPYFVAICKLGTLLKLINLSTFSSVNWSSRKVASLILYRQQEMIMKMHLKHRTALAAGWQKLRKLTR
jgi:hypothetical protein